MALRFRRSIKLAPGVRLNVGKRGLSVSAGPRGATVTVGKRGIYGNIGVPGTGLSYRKKLASSGATRGRATRQDVSPSAVRFQIMLQDDGKVALIDEQGSPLPPRVVKQIRELYGDQLQEVLQAHCDKINAGIEDILAVHLRTPSPRNVPSFSPTPFDVPKPEPPQDRPLGLLGRLLPSRRRNILSENYRQRLEHERALARWNSDRQVHELEQQKRRENFDAAQGGDAEAMHALLEIHLSGLDWPRETLVSFQVEDDGAALLLDVDLPEIEDMPDQRASVATRGLRVNSKPVSDSQRRKDYMRHVHGVAFRLLGETFALLASVQRIAISGYSQRPDSATGRINDEYLFSARVGRSQWETIDFDNLAAVDPIESIGSFELRRKMTKTGVFSAIEPFS